MKTICIQRLSQLNQVNKILGTNLKETDILSHTFCSMPSGDVCIITDNAWQQLHTAILKQYGNVYDAHITKLISQCVDTYHVSKEEILIDEQKKQLRFYTHENRFAHDLPRLTKSIANKYAVQNIIGMMPNTTDGMISVSMEVIVDCTLELQLDTDYKTKLYQKIRVQELNVNEYYRRSQVS